MVLGYHAIFGVYGFWLPNDPRGSWSDFVGSWELFRFGHATKTNERTSLAARPHDRSSRLAAKEALRRPPVHFNGAQARAVGQGFGDCVRRGRLTVWACSVLPDHVHLVIARHISRIEQIVNQLKGAATRALSAQGLHPFHDLTTEDGRVPKCWADRGWNVFLNSEEAIRRAIEYVENNPVKEGKPRQRWSFVRPFAGVDFM